MVKVKGAKRSITGNYFGPNAYVLGNFLLQYNKLLSASINLGYPVRGIVTRSSSDFAKHLIVRCRKKKRNQTTVQNRLNFIYRIDGG